MNQFWEVVGKIVGDGKAMIGLAVLVMGAGLVVGGFDKETAKEFTRIGGEILLFAVGVRAGKAQ